MGTLELPPMVSCDSSHPGLVVASLTFCQQLGGISLKPISALLIGFAATRATKVQGRVRASQARGKAKARGNPSLSERLLSPTLRAEARGYE